MGAQFEHPLIPLPENQFAQTAVERLLAPVVEFSPPLVFLHGPPGTGKSHLVMQQLEGFLSRYEGIRYRVLPVYEFSSWNMEAAGDEKGESAEQLHALADLDLLICEEVQHLDRQIWLQKKFVLLIDQLLQSGARILLCSQSAAGDFQQALPKLISRFHAGVTVSISLPAERSRISLLHHFAETRNLFLPTEVAEELARKRPVSPRELQGLIVQLEALVRLEKVPLTKETIQQFLELQQARKPPTLTEIARMVAKEFGVSVQLIRSATREQSLLIPRQVAMLLSRELIQANYADIGHFFGGRSHSTVMHACRAMLKKSHLSPELDHRVSQLRRTLQGLPSKPR